MQKGEYLEKILRANNTVFSFKEIALLWGEASTSASLVRINYYVKKGKLIRLRKGLYAKDEHYNVLECATKIFTPSYVSFETVLAKAGMIFQFYNEIFVASYLTRAIICDQHSFRFRKLQSSILTNAQDIETFDGYSIATPERAFLDTLYIHKDYYFDHLSPLNWDKVFALLPIYENKRMQKAVDKIYKTAKEN